MITSLASALLGLVLIVPTGAVDTHATAAPNRAAASIAVEESGATTTVIVTVTRLSRAVPVLVTWGDGATSSIKTSCTPTQAARGPLARCRASAEHEFAAAGTYEVSAKRGPQQLATSVITVAATTPANPAAPDASPAAAWQTEMLDRLNALRAEAGAAPLTLCSRLSTAAGDYARVMAANNHFSHTGPDGSSPGDRVAAAGYGSNVTWGENIAAGYQSVPEVMQGWRDSPGHYANMVRTSFSHVGFGKAELSSSTYGTYWVQNFGAGGTC